LATEYYILQYSIALADMGLKIYTRILLHTAPENAHQAAVLFRPPASERNTKIIYETRGLLDKAGSKQGWMLESCFFWSIN